ncbi:N5-carboxyaminoimidazole ribonucleotide synthase [Hyella patelloides LEGE 07179]|uniref:N5-carboxyaminoimidazole ribonucleotide synthase n=1 Tax=Hyella patelloides LEGE 07179 TaxID=945734 RepID=A0A563VKC0_9CYAN|nr:5-(carboxyamino)imidazole ribonucleotide synthase [Hyella patelloides]VEP11889.1 N5-carboxyaminoimidazole ribonucleotide synthase [Hyella patelloides LEGE 07179]
MAAKKIGVIGGGQLAWMMGSVAPNLDLELIVQTPKYNDPAVSKAQNVILGAIADSQATAKLATLCDVITFENEFIDLDALQSLVEQQGVIFRPSLDALAPLLDKYEQRSYLQSIGLPIPKFSLLEQKSDLQTPLCKKFPVVLKARRHGYDGQGTFIVKDAVELSAIWHKYGCPSLLIEEFIPFTKELAIMVARNNSGEIITYPVVETYQKQQVCHWVIAPAEVSQAVKKQVQAIARTLVEKLQVVGIFGIELFLTSDERVLVNEIAPRTHNSGHYTLDACDISQFEMQLRTVAEIPLTPPVMKSHASVMVNLLGYETSDSDYLEKRQQIAQLPNTYIHWYGKTDSHPGRKLGHVTVLLSAEEYSQAEEIANKIESLWYSSIP